MDTQVDAILCCAKVCVDVDINCPLLDQVTCQSEDGSSFVVHAEYTWKPLMYAHCKGWRHDSDHYRRVVKISKPSGAKWVPKKVPLTTENAARAFGMKQNKDGSVQIKNLFEIGESSKEQLNADIQVNIEMSPVVDAMEIISEHTSDVVNRCQKIMLLIQRLQFLLLAIQKTEGS